MKKLFQQYRFKESALFITVGLITALACSIYAKLFHYTENLSLSIFQDQPILLLIAAPLGLVLSFFLVKQFAPGSSGSGIPQVLACIESYSPQLARMFLGKSVIIIKFISSLIGVFVGAAIGREGPSLQISAAIAHQSHKLTEKLGLRLKVEQLLVAGAASGLAAAFNTPIGGIVYAIEELSKEHIRTFRDVLLLSVVISGLTAQLLNGNYLYLGYPVILKSYPFVVLSAVALCGLVTGILGGLFSKFLLALSSWRAKKSIQQQVMIIIGCGLILGFTFYFFGARNLYSGKDSINQVLYSSEALPWSEVLSRFFMPIISSMTGIAGGIFAPSLSAGAVVGDVFAHYFDPTMRTILALSGMVGFLSGVTHTPITSFILVLEMTDRHAAVFPMMLAALMSSIGAHLISDKSFYEESLERIKERQAQSQERS
jgi:H+/Cl- antiporter ClcA